jgi:ribose 5-phosphate isomerase B
MRIACAFDHAGTPLREAVLSALGDGGYDVLDLGDAEDYPQSAGAVAAAIVEGHAERGVWSAVRAPAFRLQPARFAGSGAQL